MSSSSNSTFNRNTGVIAGIVVALIVVSLCCRVCIVQKRRSSRENEPAEIPQSQQQFPMNPRLNIPRRPSREVWAPRLYQPTSDTTIVQPVTEPSFPQPPPEPQPIHYTPDGQPDITLELVQRMRKVQTMMAEIQRLENESRDGVNHRQQIQELQQQVIELSNTTPTTTTDGLPIGSGVPPTTNLPGSTGVGTSEPPPAYVR